MFIKNESKKSKIINDTIKNIMFLLTKKNNKSCPTLS